MTERLEESLGSLGGEEKRELLRLLMVKEREWDQRVLERFRPNRAQRRFLESAARVRLFVAANKIGKTTAGVIDLLRYALLGGKVCRVVASLGFEKGVRDVIYPEIMKWMPPGRLLREKNNSVGVVGRMYLRGDNGEESIISFMSGDQVDMSFEGDIVDYVWIDEPCRRSIYVSSLRALLVTSGRMILTLTPLSEPWIFTDLYSSESEDIESITGTLEDGLVENGGHLTREQYDFFMSLVPEEEKAARVYGEFKHLIGRVYKGFKREVHVVEPFMIPRDWPVWCSIDPHLRKPNAALFMAVSPEENWYLCNEVYFKAGIEEFGREVLRVGRQYNVVSYLIDTSSETPDWNKRDTARTLLAKLGLRTRLARKKNQKEASRFIIQQALEGKDGTDVPWLYCFRTCKRTIYEFMNYVWDMHRDETSQGMKEEPKKINDEMMDNLAYIAVERPRYGRASVIHRR